jgi:hypothetical protein
MLDAQTDSERSVLPHPTVAELDTALTAQLIVAWGGETGETPRLGWWNSDLISEFGGMDLFRRLLPSTAAWATLQAVREAARRTDVRLRAQDHAPDALMSLFSFGFEIDSRLDERLVDLKRSGRAPHSALPELAIIERPWDRDHFVDYLRRYGTTDTVPAPSGRRISAQAPIDLSGRVNLLMGALLPLALQYPLPHFRRSA